MQNKFGGSIYIVYICNMRKSKRIELSKDCIKTLTVYAAKKQTTFKPMVEQLLEKMAVKIESKAK